MKPKLNNNTHCHSTRHHHAQPNVASIFEQNAITISENDENEFDHQLDKIKNYYLQNTENRFLPKSDFTNFSENIQLLRTQININLFKKINIHKMLTLHDTVLTFLISWNHLLSTNSTNIKAQKHLVHTLEKDCFKIIKAPKWLNLIKIIGCSVLGLIAGAAIGTGVGFAAGAWSGPGAFATAAVGLFAGSITGATIGVISASIGVGTLSCAMSSYRLFHKTPLINIIKNNKKTINSLIRQKSLSYFRTDLLK